MPLASPAGRTEWQSARYRRRRTVRPTGSTSRCPAGARPAEAAGRVAGDEHMVRHVLGDHGAGAHGREAPDIVAGHDHGPGADRRPDPEPRSGSPPSRRRGRARRLAVIDRGKQSLVRMALGPMNTPSSTVTPWYTSASVLDLHAVQMTTPSSMTSRPTMHSAPMVRRVRTWARFQMLLPGSDSNDPPRGPPMGPTRAVGSITWLSLLRMRKAGVEPDGGRLRCTIAGVSRRGPWYESEGERGSPHGPPGVTPARRSVGYGSPGGSGLWLLRSQHLVDHRVRADILAAERACRGPAHHRAEAAGADTRRRRVEDREGARTQDGPEQEPRLPPPAVLARDPRRPRPEADGPDETQREPCDREDVHDRMITRSRRTCPNRARRQPYRRADGRAPRHPGARAR